MVHTLPWLPRESAASSQFSTTALLLSPVCSPQPVVLQFFWPRRPSCCLATETRVISDTGLHGPVSPELSSRPVGLCCPHPCAMPSSCCLTATQSVLSGVLPDDLPFPIASALQILPQTPLSLLPYHSTPCAFLSFFSCVMLVITYVLKARQRGFGEVCRSLAVSAPRSVILPLRLRSAAGLPHSTAGAVTGRVRLVSHYQEFWWLGMFNCL